MTIWSPELPESPARPVYLAIARALEADIRAGRLAPGERLPTHRDLAERLGVNVGTVSRAYAECERGGWIRGEVGRGTFVRGAEPDAGDLRFGRGPGASSPPAAEPPAAWIDLGLNVPVASAAPDLAPALRALAAEVEASPEGDWLAYGGPAGGAADRRAGVAALALHGVNASPADVVIAAGAQHGLSVALAAVARPGDAIACEALTYPGLAAAADARGLRVAAVSMDAHGIVPESFEEVCASTGPRALYLSPTLQNPTGSTLSRSRRERIVEIAASAGVWIVEDDVHRLLAPEAPAPLAALAPERVVYIASLSKCLAPALRVAYLAVPPALHERVVDQVWASVWSPSPITLAVASAWVRDGTLARVAAGRRAESAARQRLARDVLQRLPKGFRVSAGEAAYHLWLELAEPWTAIAFARAARDRGVGVTPADAFLPAPTRAGAPPAAVRLSLSSATDRAALDRALRILVEVAWSAPQPRVRL